MRTKINKDTMSKIDTNRATNNNFEDVTSNIVSNTGNFDFKAI